MPTKVHLVKAMVFPVVMYGCESWTKKKAEQRRIDAYVILQQLIIFLGNKQLIHSPILHAQKHSLRIKH